MQKLPTKIKELKGTREKSREVENEVEFESADGIPTPPDYFGEIARREWFSLLPQLAAVGLLNDPDLPQLRIYCWNIQIAEEAAQNVKDSGVFSKNGERPNPALKVMNEASAIVSRIAAKFGFDPVSRTKIPSGKKKEILDPMAALVKAV